MKNLIKLLSPVVMGALVCISAQGRQVAMFTMENSADKIVESLSGKTAEIHSVRPAENVAGARGTALRFDGYSTYIDAEMGQLLSPGSKKMTASIWVAVETYPIVELDVNTTEQVAIASCIDETSKNGFGFFIGFDGKYSFKTYVGGWPLELKVDTPLEQYKWINLTAVLDTEKKTATLYNNGTPVASSRANGTLSVAASTLRIGRSKTERNMGVFCTTSFNGLVDDITVWDEAVEPSVIAGWSPENPADLTIPADRFAGDPMRPTFHGMPGANWTNETHGMTYSNGRYHVFFQKNANGPYMARLHWGHISSPNLYNWREEQIALTPGAAYDIKGCWSGCVFSDDEITGGKPSIIYTGVDYVKAVIAQANPVDDDLIEWTKVSIPVINGRPNGLSDDFRDPYFFRSGNQAYIIVGSSKGGVGTTTLHAYNPTARTWSNDGKTFFTGTNTATCGTFWEMPNITRIGDKWLFTTTPQNTSKGVAAIYWTGTINADGTFKADKTAPADIELTGFARHGYGLLSPTVYQHDGKTIAMGIVPDKLPGSANYNLGFAHTYSLPREWSIDSNGNLCQKPFAGLVGLRDKTGFSLADFDLNGSLDIDGITGREVELSGEFTVGTGKCGFTLVDDGVSAIKVYYDGASNEVVVDARGVDRLINDADVFDGYYHSTLPRQLAKGETLKLNVFFDHSIIDIFINDTWATSVRIFANAKTTEGVTVFTDAPNHVKTLKGWTLDAKNDSGVTDVESGASEVILKTQGGMLYYDNMPAAAVVSIFNLAGSKVFTTRVDTSSGYIDTVLSGFYIVEVTDPNGHTARTTHKLIF